MGNGIRNAERGNARRRRRRAQPRVSTLGWVFLNRFALEGHQEPHLKERAGSIPDLEGINSGAHSGRPALNAVTQD